MIKVDIFSGFLGAGKTTLIKKLLEEAYKGEKLVLIENEFGEIGIDGGFLKEAGIKINEMNSGCICCSLVGDFETALKQVISEYKPERILIEPSGVGKLSDIINAVENIDIDEVELNTFTTVVDAKKVKIYMKNFGEFYNNQVEFASAIVFSHTKDMDEKKLEAAVKLVKEHNDHAVLVTTDWDELTGKQILDAMEKKDTLKEALEMLEEEEHHHHHHHEHDEECDCHEHEHHHHHEHDEECTCGCHDHEHEHEHHHHHEHGEECSCGCGHHHADEVFESIGIETAKKFTKEKIEEILNAFDSGEFGTILRAKGMVDAVEGSWIHFDYVPEEIDVRTGSSDVIGKICVIGANIDEEKIRKALD